jgi:serine/threonine protein phosphatase PrpC
MMSKKPLAYKGMMGGITRESAVNIYTFLRNEADMDDDLTSVEYYNGVLDGMGTVMNGEIFSQKLLEEMKTYGIETIEHPAPVVGDDGRPCEPRKNGDQDRPLCPSGY